MRKRIVLILLYISISVSTTAMAQETSAADAGQEDDKVISVLEILELMQMLDNIALFKDMEYLTEGEPHEPQN